MGQTLASDGDFGVAASNTRWLGCHRFTVEILRCSNQVFGRDRTAEARVAVAVIEADGGAHRDCSDGA